MLELDDDKTDKLFQVGADRHDFEYDPAAWEKMQGLLAADDLRRARLNWLTVMGGLFVLLLIVFAWVNYSADSFAEAADPNTQAEEGLAERPTPQDIAAVNSTAELPNKSAGVSAQSPTAALAPTTGFKPENFRRITDDSPISTNQKSRVGSDPGGIPEQVSQSLERSTAGTAVIGDELSNSELRTTGGPADVLTPTTDKKRHLNAINRLPAQPFGLLDYSRTLETVSILPADEVPTFESSSPSPGIAVGLAVGFASGKTRTGDFSAPRLRFGGRVDYRLNNHLSVGTGAFLTRIDYKSDGKEYKTGEDFWRYDVVPTTVKADCDILEIPLSLTWHPRGNHRSGLYFGAGLTSYFMVTEKFSFKYDVPDEDLIKGWREDNTNQHLLGMGQINIGFQRKTSQRTALQLESFVQLPLTGIGHGSVNLLTVGASVNYTFDFRKKR